MFNRFYLKKTELKILNLEQNQWVLISFWNLKKIKWLILFRTRNQSKWWSPVDIYLSLIKHYYDNSVIIYNKCSSDQNESTF